MSNRQVLMCETSILTTTAAGVGHRVKLPRRRRPDDNPSYENGPVFFGNGFARSDIVLHRKVDPVDAARGHEFTGVQEILEVRL